MFIVGALSTGARKARVADVVRTRDTLFVLPALSWPVTLTVPPLGLFAVPLAVGLTTPESASADAGSDRLRKLALQERRNSRACDHRIGLVDLDHPGRARRVASLVRAGAARVRRAFSGRTSVTKALTGPESVSAQSHFTVTSLLFQPFHSPRVCELNVIVGLVLSIFTSRVALAGLPALSVQVPLASAVPSAVRTSVTKAADRARKRIGAGPLHRHITVVPTSSRSPAGVCETNVIDGSVLSTFTLIVLLEALFPARSLTFPETF